MTPLPQAFLDRPIAHRALHDVTNGRPENSRAAIKAAMEQGYGIEIDLQLSADDQALVFHDYDLGRLTTMSGPIRVRPAAELQSIPLSGGDEGIPGLAEVLEIVGGKVPLLIELKDQDGAMGKNVGALEMATAAALGNYAGPTALMSFNPHSVAKIAGLLPGIPCGLTTAGYSAEHWPTLPTRVRDHLRDIPDFDHDRYAFISHDTRDLKSLAVTKLKQAGVHVLCWTTRSPQEERDARRVADNVTFEGYLA